ncbi:MAG: hypothetical protein K2O10_02425, partial [Muribaculaceae bacterium]|nr:hypothetical protein [Muribaculaceae bacterium]
PYVTFSNITVAAPEGNGSRTPYAALQLRNGSHHCRVEQCVVSAPLVSANDNRTYVLMANAGQDAASTCDWLTVTGTRIEGGYVGFYAGTDPEGDSGLTTTGLVFTGNDIANVALRSAQIVECDGFSFTGNSITPGSAGKKSAHHLELRKPTGAFRVEANKLLIGQGSECTGIYLRDGGGSGDAANPAIIANNVIAMPKVAEAYSYGMMIDAAMTNVVIAHNSVCLTSASTTLRNVYAMAFNGTSAPEGVAPQIVNNMLSAGLSGMPLRPWNDSHYARLAFAGNVYYSACGYIDGDSKDIAQYRQATGDASSVWAQPEFMSTSDLHLAEVADEMYVASTPWVTVDYDGRQRTVTTVAGAYEYERQMVEKPVMAEGYPQIYAVTDKSKWSVGGMLYVKAVDASDAIPSPEAMKTATAATAVDADREVVSEFTGLQPSTSYRACFMLESALGQLSDIVVSDVFVTPDEIQPLEAFIYWQDEPFMAGENVELMAVAEGGVMPYVYTWTD